MMKSVFVFILVLVFASLVGCGSAADGATDNDESSPTTAAVPSGGIYNSDQEVTLSCSDGGNGLGCGTISYYTEVRGVRSSAVHTVRHWSLLGS